MQCLQTVQQLQGKAAYVVFLFKECGVVFQFFFKSLALYILHKNVHLLFALIDGVILYHIVVLYALAKCELLLQQHSVTVVGEQFRAQLLHEVEAAIAAHSVGQRCCTIVANRHFLLESILVAGKI